MEIKNKKRKKKEILLKILSFGNVIILYLLHDSPVTEIFTRGAQTFVASTSS